MPLIELYSCPKCGRPAFNLTIVDGKFRGNIRCTNCAEEMKVEVEPAKKPQFSGRG